MKSHNTDVALAALGALPAAAELLHRLPRPTAGALLVAVIDFANANAALVEKDVMGAAHRAWEAIRTDADLERALCVPAVDSPVSLIKHLLDTVGAASTLREVLSLERDRIDRALATLDAV